MKLSVKMKFLVNTTF